MTAPGPWLAAAGALAVLALPAAGVARPHGYTPAAGSYQRFHSRPDLRPVAIEIRVKPRGTSPGYVFLAPKKRTRQSGPLIVDDSGRPIWFRPVNTGGATDFRVQTYRGRPVLTWWEGRSELGVGHGRYVIVDDRYRHVATVRAVGRVLGDEHEFRLTRRGTALVTVYRPARGRPGLLDSGFQEIDVATGRLVFSWWALAHVPVADTYAERRPPRPLDYFHLNSVELEPDGTYLVSSRNTRAIYSVARSGRVLWRLGGKRSDFRLGPRVRFAWQHDARRVAADEISLFDNEASPPVRVESRALFLHLDLRARRATVVHEFTHRPEIRAGSQGNVQLLPDGHVFVGWGAKAYFTEFDASGRIVFDARFTNGTDSYRAYRFRWTGWPTEPPAAAGVRGGDGAMTVYASWNGATEVSSWQVLAGPGPRRLEAVAWTPRRSFETAVPVARAAPFVAVRALDELGRPLGTSPAVRTR